MNSTAEALVANAMHASSVDAVPRILRRENVGKDTDSEVVHTVGLLYLRVEPVVPRSKDVSFNITYLSGGATSRT